VARDAAGPHIKGACLIEALSWLEKNRGRERLEAALRLMPAGGRNDVDLARASFGILSSEWYPAANTHSVLDAMTAGMDPGARARMAREMAKAVMDGTLKGVYGIMFSMMATPERYARHAPRLWGKYYDEGEVRLRLSTPKSMTATVSDWQGHHPFLCEVVRFARVAALEAMGCRAVQSELRCKTAVGGDDCVTELRWA
jgi:hypothetical protein